MKKHFRLTLRIPGRLQYQFWEVHDIPVEVDLPDRHVVGYPNDAEEYLTPAGLRQLDEILTNAVRQESTVQIDEDSVEEGW